MSVRQIAKLAGVSPATVSLALTNSPKLADATKRKVLAVARKHGYRRNGKVTELMSEVRLCRTPERQACFGVISFYDSPRPWENSLHLSRIYEGMTHRAETLGYRLEPMWMRQPGMTYRRFRGILDARGIEGLLCFGSPNFDEEFPAQFDRYAIVTQGLSIKTHLHRVVSHVYNDMWRALQRVHKLGYRHPGLVISRYEEARSAHAYFCVYLGWSQLVRGVPAAIPVLQTDGVEAGPLLAWINDYRPDVILFVHHYDWLPKFREILDKNRIRCPEDIGVLAISQSLEGTGFSGLQENQELIGAWTVELLVSRIMNRDFGIPEAPRVEMVERRWIEGKSLREQ